MSYPDADQHDTASHAWRDICFARWICTRPDLEARRDFLGRFRRRHGDVLAEHVEALVREQWAARSRWLRTDDAEPRDAPPRDLFTEM